MKGNINIILYWIVIHIIRSKHHYERTKYAQIYLVKTGMTMAILVDTALTS